MELLRRCIPGTAIPAWNNPESPPARGAAKTPWLPVSSTHCQTSTGSHCPLRGSPAARATPRGGSPSGSQAAQTAAEPGTAAPQFIAAQGSGCTRLLAATRGSCVGSSGHTPAPSPRALTRLSPGFSPGRNPVTPLGAERDSVRAPQGIHVLVNPHMALKFGGVFPVESSARGQWEQWWHLRDPRSQQPLVTVTSLGTPRVPQEEVGSISSGTL